jgi:hypothetical protein
MMKMMGEVEVSPKWWRWWVVRVSDQPKTTTLLHLFPASKKGR